MSRIARDVFISCAFDSWKCTFVFRKATNTNYTERISAIYSLRLDRYASWDLQWRGTLARMPRLFSSKGAKVSTGKSQDYFSLFFLLLAHKQNLLPSTQHAHIYVNLSFYPTLFTSHCFSYHIDKLLIFNFNCFFKLKVENIETFCLYRL